MASSAFKIIRGGRLLEIAAHRAELADVLIEDDTIREIGRPGMAAPEGATPIDADDRVLMPGLVNTHMHAHGALAKGMMADRWPLELLLNANPAVNSERSLEDKGLSALVSAVEMVRKGCTACFDMFVEFPLPSVEGLEAVGRAYQQVGMRAVVAPMMADRTLYEALPGLMEAIPRPLRDKVEKIRLAPFEASIEACRDMLKRWPFDRSRIRPALAPTIPLHCSDPFLRHCRDLAKDYDVCLQTHLAESKVQAVVGLEKYGKTLTAHLHDLGLLSPRFSAAHAIWVDGDDLRMLADSGASVVHNPLSNLRFGSGLAAVDLMGRLGVNVGIGTDAANSADSLNMFEATRLASYVSRVQSFRPESWLSSDQVLTMATEGGARAMGFDGEIGRLAPGFKADIVFLDLAHIHYVPLNDITRQIVFSENGAAVDSVMIGGRLIVEAGRLTSVDESKLRCDVEQACERLRAASEPNRNFARKLEDYVGAFCATQVQRPYHVHRHLGDTIKSRI
jgi:5-methylthioadenosine/S-adenosylhomocysteine deaminase